MAWFLLHVNMEITSPFTILNLDVDECLYNNDDDDDDDKLLLLIL